MCICFSFSAEVAIEYGKQFRMFNCTNGFIPSLAHMPEFGQCGSSGFIIFAGDGTCITRKTSAFLQVGEAAFTEVEKIIGDHLSPDPTRNFGKLSSQRLHVDHPYSCGCTAKLAGQTGEPEFVKVLGFTSRTGKFTVSTFSGHCMTVGPSRLAPLRNGDAIPAALADEESASSSREEMI
mgnify:CR=1 FL=1|jgi:hypothetical protein